MAFYCRKLTSTIYQAIMLPLNVCIFSERKCPSTVISFYRLIMIAKGIDTLLHGSIILYFRVNLGYKLGGSAFKLGWMSGRKQFL